MKAIILKIFFLLLGSLILVACNRKDNVPGEEAIKAINLKQGAVVLCGPPDKQLGKVSFINSCSEKVKKDFDLAIALLHSFEYDEAEKVFAKVIEQEPGCAMAYWGVAMSNYHQVWPSPPSPSELEKGDKSITIAASLSKKSKIEEAFIDAMGVFYKDWNLKDHRTRSLEYVGAMEKIHTNYPSEKEAAVFYALSLVATAEPSDKTYSNQRKAGFILNNLYPGEPDHPGIVHYIIHSYDNPELAELALPAAKKYAGLAPASAHAQHMPSHIFTRLGLWEESIQSNLVSTSAAKCYAETAGIKGHWDEELHGMDYLVYAYLQKGENDLAKQQLDYLKTMEEVHPANFKVAYAFAAIPSRYVLENKMWKEAANLKFHSANFRWENFPWQKAIVHFARLMGNVQLGNLGAAKTELASLKSLHDTLVALKDSYKASQVMIQAKAGEAWILFKEGKKEEGLERLMLAADLEDKTEKSPVTPGAVLPAKELLADLLLQLDRPSEALDAYAAVLKTNPNRFNALYGAAQASENLKDMVKAGHYYKQLLGVANSKVSKRPELQTARLFLNNESALNRPGLK